MPSGAGGKGIVVIRYVPSVGGGATMAEWQDVPAGVYEIPTTNGAGSMNLEIVVLDGRKWAKIPYINSTSFTTPVTVWSTRTI